MSDPIEIRRLSERTGAEIVGYDFTRTPSDEAIDGWHAAVHRGHAALHRWHAALDEFQLLVFRGARLEAEAQVAHLETLGPVLLENENGRAYQFVSNTHDEGILGDEAFAFHSDHAFMPDPIDVIALYGLEIPATGTQTRFVNGLAAARELPDPLRKRIGNRRARHIIDPTAHSDVIPVRRPTLSDELPHAYHPILSRHPKTGAEILYVSEQQTDSVEGLDAAEGRDLIESLFEHLYAPRFAYQHSWREGDLVVWDNRALQHAREAVPRGVSRTLRRVSVGGTSVYDFFKSHVKWQAP